MALIACPDCGQTVLDVASVCPHCAYDLAASTERFDYVTGQRVGLAPRPAAQLARRPFRYPSSLGLGLMIGGAGAVVVGSFLPWTSEVGAESGLSGSGPITLALGLALVLLGISARVSPSYVPRVLVLVGGLVTLAVAIRSIPDAGASTGFRLLLAGATAAVVGSVLRER